MKILAICGSPRKGNTFSVLRSIEENYPEFEFNLLQLNKLNFEMCKGCTSAWNAYPIQYI